MLPLTHLLHTQAPSFSNAFGYSLLPPFLPPPPSLSPSPTDSLSLLDSLASTPRSLSSSCSASPHPLCRWKRQKAVWRTSAELTATPAARFPSEAERQLPALPSCLLPFSHLWLLLLLLPAVLPLVFGAPRVCSLSAPRGLASRDWSGVWRGLRSEEVDVPLGGSLDQLERRPGVETADTRLARWGAGGRLSR